VNVISQKDPVKTVFSFLWHQWIGTKGYRRFALSI